MPDTLRTGPVRYFYSIQLLVCGQFILNQPRGTLRRFSRQRQSQRWARKETASLTFLARSAVRRIRSVSAFSSILGRASGAKIRQFRSATVTVEFFPMRFALGEHHSGERSNARECFRRLGARCAFPEASCCGRPATLGFGDNSWRIVSALGQERTSEQGCPKVRFVPGTGSSIVANARVSQKCCVSKSAT
jgi:hypothetical protein